jgi:hypothetical protein
MHGFAGDYARAAASDALEAAARVVVLLPDRRAYTV